MSLIGAKIGRSFAGATCPFLEVSAKRFSRINNSIIWQGRIGVFVTAYVSDSRASIYSHVLVPVSHSVLDPETAHRLAILMLSMGLAPRERVPDAQELEVEIFGKKISNPIWLAAGFDKNGEAIDSLFDLGFGAVEVGSVTPNPQTGNPPPRVFRLSKDSAIINRYGFNSLGSNLVLLELRKRLLNYNIAPEMLNRSLKDKKILGVNVGRNRDSSESSTDDYIRGVETFAAYADYLVLNVSSPNTPGLTKMQKKDNIDGLLSAAIKTRDTIAKEINRRVPICIKISPDLSDKSLEELLEVTARNKIDGIIVANTTASRPCDLQSAPDLITEEGGLSGPPLKPRALSLVKRVRQFTKGAIPIIASGGVSSADDALEYARSGANVVQLYTSFVYNGPCIATKIKIDLAKKLREQNTTWKDVIASGLE